MRGKAERREASGMLRSVESLNRHSNISIFVSAFTFASVRSFVRSFGNERERKKEKVKEVEAAKKEEVKKKVKDPKRCETTLQLTGDQLILDHIDTTIESMAWAIIVCGDSKAFNKTAKRQDIDKTVIITDISISNYF